MNKRDFVKYIKTNIDNLPTEKQELELKKIKNEWIPYIIDNMLKTKTLCENCKRYSDTSKYKKISVRETRIETTYTDAGYGDDDRHGEVEYIIDYLECPICNHKHEINKHYVRILWEKDRYGNKY